MKKKSSFGNKLLLQVLGVSIFVFAITMFFLTSYSYESVEKSAEQYLKEVANNNSKTVQAKMNEAVTIANFIADQFNEAIKNKDTLNKNVMLAQARSIINNSNFIMAIWYQIKPKFNQQFFEKNMEKAGKGSYDIEGQFNPYIATSKSGIVISPGEVYNEELEWVKGAIDDGKTHITKPYSYPVDGVDVLMSTISIPLYHNNQLIGVVGVDVSLDSFTEMTKNLKLYENGYSSIIDHYGIILGHPKETLINKKINVVTKNNPKYAQMLKNTRKGKDTLFLKKSFKDGIESLFFTKAIKIKQAEQYWSYVVSIPKDEYLADANFLRNFTITALFICLLIIGLILYISIRKLNSNLSSISSGLSEFFKFLNKEGSSTSKIEITSNDEFGEMAKQINSNIESITQNIKEENNLIEDVKTVVNSINKGFFYKRVRASTNNEAMLELKNLLNNMLENLQTLVGKDLNEAKNILTEYTNANFLPKLSKQSGLMGGQLNELNAKITQMLQANQSGGLNIEKSSQELTKNIQVLSNNATSQAASLEQTAASIEEVTSNIQSTSQKAQEMFHISSETKDSANKGKDLANQTVTSMDEINEQVSSINEAITVIDQIAFQTNILSLNAAVEAATAGEAGKGFAVVAQEVRNLASRSAEAAKEIKDLVETATLKANTGKDISSSMIEGFNHLEEKIFKTNKLINDVSTASKEQSSAMVQIADAINQLDKFTQENATIADKTTTIANKTLEIATDFVQEANKNEFEGKK